MFSCELGFKIFKNCLVLSFLTGQWRSVEPVNVYLSSSEPEVEVFVTWQTEAWWEQEMPPGFQELTISIKILWNIKKCKKWNLRTCLNKQNFLLSVNLFLMFALPCKQTTLGISQR